MQQGIGRFQPQIYESFAEFHYTVIRLIKRLGDRDKQTLLLGVRTNLNTYNPTDPDAVLQALADISVYLYNDKDTDPLIKAALVHYQFEMVHQNGIVGRIIVPMILRQYYK